MTNDAFNIEIIFIRRGIGTRQHIFGVKDVQPFILHRPHIKEVDGNDHIDVEVVFETKALFIPLHGIFQRGHCPRRAVEVATVNEQLQRHFAPGTGFEGIAQHVEIARHQRKQVARLRERILPLYPVTAIIQLTFGNTVAVGQQERIFALIGGNFSGKTRQHVRAVEIPGNMAEAFGLTLSTQRFT